MVKNSNDLHMMQQHLKKYGSFIYIELIININKILEISIVCILVNTINKFLRNLWMLSYRFLKSEVF